MAEIIGVSALNTYVRSLLEGNEALQDIAIKGEISNFNRNYKSGHCYFSIKDAKASVRVVMFRTAAERLAFRPENGMAVVARGRVTLYERDGTYQMNAEYLFPDGVGAAQMAFEQLRARLEAEGLFDPQYKKPLPRMPGKIGLVTSKTGAALQDILQVAQRRCPLAQFVLAPVLVQGDKAPAGIVRAVKILDEMEDVELILIARGGGSAEDLWVFNAEEVARAVYLAATPVLSAIGHETDFTILDFVADARAPTPSAAAEMALPDMSQEMAKTMHAFVYIANNIQFRIDSWYNVLQRHRQDLQRYSPQNKARNYAKYLKEAGRRAQRAARQALAAKQGQLQTAAALAAGLNPYAVLARGYSVATAGGKPLHSVAQVAPGADVRLVLPDGKLKCKVLEKTEERMVP
ncbi:exodeoxyribonuclease VII large subunit [Ruminococcaceae bacterium OttesenSCG-928-O06]|nr:exodeoxyribonuclease VII large subunit [Ruminococcaceae bacterium OttesenSCG-928-O06]